MKGQKKGLAGGGGKPENQKDASKKQEGITVKKDSDLSEWYTQVVAKAELADYTAVSGCMVLRPYSYAVWERIQQVLDKRFREMGVKNCYFPLFIPEQLFRKEAAHVKGFSPEVAWVTMAGGSELSEKLAVRPTSETIMYDSFSKWIRSWRDLPLLLNQWCNVVRWEFKYPKPFLRTREFLWQEGHTAHESEKEADRQTLAILDVYRELIEGWLAIPVISGRKSEAEKFAGALYTTALEALMPDGRALQMGTSHNLGQNFSKAFNITFLGKDGSSHYAWQTSWGVTTRMIGALIMVHGDERGLVMPPKVAPLQVVIVPIVFDDTKAKVLKKCRELKSALEKRHSVLLDDRDGYTPGWKFNEWELKGVPVRIELGPRDLEKGRAVIVRRDTGEKEPVKLTAVASHVSSLLDRMQNELFVRAKKRLEASIVDAPSIRELQAAVLQKKLVMCFFCGSESCEAAVREKCQGVSSRVTLLDGKKGRCISCGKQGSAAYFGRSYQSRT